MLKAAGWAAASAAYSANTTAMASQPARAHSRSRVDFSRFKSLNSVEGGIGRRSGALCPPFTLSESRRDQCADRARLYVVEHATVVRRTRVDVVGDAVRIAEVLTVQFEGPATVLEPRAQIDGVVARQLWTHIRGEP